MKRFPTPLVGRFTSESLETIDIIISKQSVTFKTIDIIPKQFVTIENIDNIPKQLGGSFETTDIISKSMLL